MAKLKAVVDSVEGLDEALKALYRKREDGKFELDSDTDGHSTISPIKSALDREREERRKAKERLGHLLTKIGASEDEVEDVIDQLLTTRTEHEKTKGKKSFTVEELEAELAKRLEGVTKKQTKEIKDRDDKIAAQAARLSALLIDSAVGAAAAKSKVRATALQDVLNRAKMVFTLENDQNVVAKGRDGQPIYSTKDPQKVLGIEEWIGNLSEDAPHLFEASSGAGAGGNGQGAGAGRSDGQVIMISRADATDGSKYRAAQERATKEGKRLQIEPLKQ